LKYFFEGFALLLLLSNSTLNNYFQRIFTSFSFPIKLISLFRFVFPTSSSILFHVKFYLFLIAFCELGMEEAERSWFFLISLSLFDRLSFRLNFSKMFIESLFSSIDALSTAPWKLRFTLLFLGLFTNF